MPEVQRHGFAFENWVKKTFFAEFESVYTQKWDITGNANHLAIIPKELHDLPVSIKTCKFGCAIGFGDALRQFNNAEDFLLIVGFWKQSEGYKNFVAVEGVKIRAKQWKDLFYPSKIDDLKKLDAAIKDKATPFATARLNAKQLKRELQPMKIILNPKIDSKKQRRLQCSLPFNVFWQDIVGKESYENVKSDLFGKRVPNPFLSSIRSFKPKLD